MSEPLNYATPTRDAHGSRPFAKVLAAAVFILVLGQFAWFFGWALLLRSVFPDGALKRPLTDFFAYIGIAIPSIAIVLVTGLRCWIEYHQKASVRSCIGSIIASVLAIVFIGLIVAGWVVDDIINVNVPR